MTIINSSSMIRAPRRRTLDHFNFSGTAAKTGNFFLLTGKRYSETNSWRSNCTRPTSIRRITLGRIDRDQ
jgi:hypothetical protein